MLVEEVTPDGRWLDTGDVHIRYRTRLIGIKRRVETNFRHVLQTVHPVARQVSQSRFLALAAKSVVKQHRLTDRETRRCGMCSDLFKLTNVIRLLRLGRHQRPEL